MPNQPEHQQTASSATTTTAVQLEASRSSAANQTRVLQRRNELEAGGHRCSRFNPWRLVAPLDLRFTDPSIEFLYHIYYAQEKRKLLPTAIQVVLLVNVLQFSMTLLNYYLISGQDFELGSVLSSSTLASSSRLNSSDSSLASSVGAKQETSGHMFFSGLPLSSSPSNSLESEQQSATSTTSTSSTTSTTSSTFTQSAISNFASSLWWPIVIQLLIFLQAFYLSHSLRKELNGRHRRASSSLAAGFSDHGAHSDKQRPGSASSAAAAAATAVLHNYSSASSESSSAETSSTSSDEDEDQRGQQLQQEGEEEEDEDEDEDEEDDDDEGRAQCNDGARDNEAIELKRKKNNNRKNNAGRDKKNTAPLEPRDKHQATVGARLLGGSATLAAAAKQRQRQRRTRRRLSSNAHHARRQQVSCYRLAMPYVVWLLQLVQIGCALWPQQAFIAYSMLLLYSYTIYVILPIRLPWCILLACALCLLEPALDWLLLLKLSAYFSAPDYQPLATARGVGVGVGGPTANMQPTTDSRSFGPANATSAPPPNAVIASVLSIPMSTQVSKLWAFMVLALGVNIIGIMSFFFYERQQRTAFIETRQNFATKKSLEQESREQERLLLSILPKHLASEIRQDLGAVLTGQFKKIYMRRHENVSILFADIVGFTAISSACPAAQLVKTLNELFARFDKLAEKYHQLRIKILGDCYYAISGAPKERSDHAVLCVHMGLSMVEAIKSVRELTKSTVDMRVGVHTGGVLAGVLGQRQWQFDVYSKDVELANKMESSGAPGRVHISNATLRFLHDEFEVCEGYGAEREESLRLANIKTYFIVRVKKPYPEGTLDAPSSQPDATAAAARPEGGPSNQAVAITVNNSKAPAATTAKQTRGVPRVALKAGRRERRQKRRQRGQEAAVAAAPGNELDQRGGLALQQAVGGGASNGTVATVGGKQAQSDSFESDNQIKRFSLNFFNAQFEKQFRSTSDITSCVSLVGLPITLICAAASLAYLYQVPLDVQIVYTVSSALLLVAVLVCVLPYWWRLQEQRKQRLFTRRQYSDGATQVQDASTSGCRERISSSLASSGALACQSERAEQLGALANCVLSVSRAVSKSAAMKLALSALMTLVWLSAHLLACNKLIELFSALLPVLSETPPIYSSKLDDLIQQRRRASTTTVSTVNHGQQAKQLEAGQLEETLFGVDLFNYLAITCALAITAITRISFLVKTLTILVVILQQVILNKTILANLLMLRSNFLLLLPGGGARLPVSSSLSTSDQRHLFKNQTAFRGEQSDQLQQHYRLHSAFYSINLDPIQVQFGKTLADYDQFVFMMTLCTICWALFLMNRQFELTNRRLFLWRKQAEERKEKVADLRRKNEMLVYNILPPNVAKIFLGKRQLNDEALYSKSYDAVGVLFAAMPNFSDFYSEESVNNQGLECLRFLNEVISDYDALLDQDRFKNIIKIKTMGSTYMAASGLYEGDARAAAADELLFLQQQQQRQAALSAQAGGQQQQQPLQAPAHSSCSVELGNASASEQQQQQHEDDEIKSKWGHLEQLTEFALALKDTLSNINKESFNNFVLRIGINQGPITAGVIGAKKPHFDMWGNTVNVASRMESTGRAGSIQVVKETATILRHFGFEFDQRGLVFVKGKGKLMTFYLTGRSAAAAAAAAANNKMGSSCTPPQTTAASIAGSPMQAAELEQQQQQCQQPSSVTNSSAAPVTSPSSNNNASQQGASKAQQSSSSTTSINIQSAGPNATTTTADTSDKRMFITQPPGQRASFSNDSSDIHLV